MVVLKFSLLLFFSTLISIP